MAVRLLRPSGADTWAWCGASEELQERYPELADNDKAREGTASHFYVANALLGRPPAIGTLAPNGWVIDAEMVECGNAYLDFCRREMAQASPTALIRVETKVTMHGLIHPLCEGTPDFFVVDSARKRIVVPDYKYGHRPVDAFQRLQALCYLAGCMEALELTGEDIADWTVEIVIIQPRSYHPEGTVRTWTLSGADAYRWIVWLSDRAASAASGVAPCNTGEWCHDCTARIYCAAFQASAQTAMDYSREAFASDLSNGSLGIQLDLVTRAMAKLKAMQTGLEEVAQARLRGGQVVPGYGIRPKDGNLTWTDPQQAMALGATLGLDFRKPPMTSTVITPTQAMKEYGLPPELVNAYATRKTSHELTKIDETIAKRAFGS